MFRQLMCVGCVVVLFSQPATARTEDVFVPPLATVRVAPAPVEETDSPTDVRLSLVVGEDGRVSSVEVVQSGGDERDQAAIEAARAWQFEPGRMGDQPVVSRVPLTFRFEPSDEAPDDGLAALEAELAAELDSLQLDPQSSPAPVVEAPNSSVGYGLSNSLNPSISANGLFLAGWSSRHDEEAGEHSESEHSDEGHGGLETGLFVQEVEVLLSSVVDPYFRADLALAAHADEIGFEEAYLTTLSLPMISLRVGQMFATVGRHNRLHTHAFPFIEAPMPWSALLGSEGLSDPGLSAELLLPTPFYAELTGQAFMGDWHFLEPTEADEADARENSDFGYVGHLKTLWEVGESTTIEIGGSYVGGRAASGDWSHLAGADLTLKWRPIQAERYTGLDWTVEYLVADAGSSEHSGAEGGGYSSLRYQFGQRWWVQGRGALLGFPEAERGTNWKTEALIGFIPSEFSALRLQYAYEQSEGEDPVQQLFLQAVFSIGSHPAHAY